MVETWGDFSKFMDVPWGDFSRFMDVGKGVNIFGYFCIAYCTGVTVYGIREV
jgi:hypothetical protein